VSFGGQRHQFQCPLCDLSIAGSRGGTPRARIRAAWDLHLEGCDGRIVDPIRLRAMTRDAAREEAERLRETESPADD
jgi:hypothetical protein